MNQETLQQQRRQAKANLELVGMAYKRKRATLAEYEKAKEVYEALKAAQPVQERMSAKAVQEAKREEYRPEEKQRTPVLENLVKEVQQELFQIDAAKRRLSNQLDAVPAGKKCKDLVDQILKLRDDWTAKGDELRYVIEHGKRPEVETESEFDQGEFIRTLPREKLELDRLIRNEKSNLSKHRKKLRDASTDAKKAHYAIQVAQCEIRISAMQTTFNALS
ncbi:hypothetical protein [Siphonobacter sp.]|uniref:hypothetical protein n=1 Tax=Siphonobacter sp. TaxID=1869184 RepID=UPI003B3A168A